MPRQVSKEWIDISKPRDYFDEASQGEPPLGGVGGIIYFFISHTISFKVGIGPRPNNLVEMLASKLTFTLTNEYGITRIQIFGDLLLIMNWFNKKFTLRNFTLHPLFDLGISGGIHSSYLLSYLSRKK